MDDEHPDYKTCNRCGHVWMSYTGRPVRCPGCGTYHWNEKPTTNTCRSCGHSWFSRTVQTPIRCPRCKTRSWNAGAEESASGSARRLAEPYELGDIAERYSRGQGCVRISMDTGVSLEKVIRVIRAEMDETSQLRMRI